MTTDKGKGAKIENGKLGPAHRLNCVRQVSTGILRYFVCPQVVMEFKFQILRTPFGTRSEVIKAKRNICLSMDSREGDRLIRKPSYETRGSDGI